MAEQEFTTEELQNEIWKEIPGFDGYYSVSNIGRVRRDKTGSGTWAGRILHPSYDSDGYLLVSLSVRDRATRCKVHRLVTLTFIGPAGKRTEVNHKDGRKDNNRLKNLEYATTMQNMQHAHAKGLYPSGEQHYLAKLTEEQARAVLRLIDGGARFIDVARRYNVSLACIRQLYIGKSWKHLVRGPMRSKRLPISVVIQIKQLLADGMKGSEIARQLTASCGTIVSPFVVSRIKHNQVQRYLEPTSEVQN